jgi:hypothetical protein
MSLPRLLTMALALLLLAGLIQVAAQTTPVNSNLVVTGHINSCTTGPTGTTGNAYACTLGYPLTALQPQACYGFTADIANTGPATINYQGLGAQALVKTQGGVTTPLAAGDIRAGMVVHTCYDGANMQCQNCVGNAPTAATTPGGTPSQAQWNSAGTFAGSSGLTVDATSILTRTDHVTLDTGGMLLGAHNVVTCTPGATDKLYTLPPAATAPVGSYQVIKMDADAGACVVQPDGEDTINGVQGSLRLASMLQQAQLTRIAATGWFATVAMATGVSAQSGTSYTLSASDVGKLVTLNNPALVSVTIPSATRDGFGLGAVLALRNLGSGVVTMNAGASTIDGVGTLSLPRDAHVTLWSDGTHYWSQAGFRNPMTTAGDLIGASANGQASRIPTGKAQQVLVAGGLAPAHFASFPQVIYVPAARCAGGVASAQWSTGASPAATCRAGTNNHEAFLAWGAADTAEVSLALPLDWDPALPPAVSLLVASTTTTAAQTLQMQVASACAKGDGTTTDDVAWNATQNLTLVTTNTTAGQTWRATLAGLTMTNCSAGGLLRLRVSRGTDTAVGVRVYGLSVTIPRLPTMQAN